MRGIDDKKAARPAGNTAARMFSTLPISDSSAGSGIGIATSWGGSGSMWGRLPVGLAQFGQKFALGGRRSPHVQDKSIAVFSIHAPVGGCSVTDAPEAIIEKQKLNCTVAGIQCYTERGD